MPEPGRSWFSPAAVGPGPNRTHKRSLSPPTFSDFRSQVPYHTFPSRLLSSAARRSLREEREPRSLFFYTICLPSPRGPRSTRTWREPLASRYLLLVPNVPTRSQRSKVLLVFVGPFFFVGSPLQVCFCTPVSLLSVADRIRTCQ